MRVRLNDIDQFDEIHDYMKKIFFYAKENSFSCAYKR